MPFISTLVTSGLVAAGAGAIGGGALIIAPTAGGLALASTGTAALVQGLVSVGLSIGASYGAALLSSSLSRKQQTQRTDITIKQALPNRWVDVGRVKTAGALVFLSSPGLYLHNVKVLSCCRIQEIETIYLDDYATTNPTINTGAPVGFLNGPWFSLSLVEARLGADDQTALTLPQLSGSWTVNHRLLGMAAISQSHAQGDKKNFSTAYPNGVPSAAAVIKGAMVPDPRNNDHDMEDQSTWEYSDNYACVGLRMMLDRDGIGVRPSIIDYDIWAQACDDSDDDMETTTGTEKRYRAWGRYSTSEDRSSMLRRFLESGDARLIEQPTGKLGLFVGKHRPAVVTIDSGKMLEINLKRLPNAMGRVDGIRPIIVWEGASWQAQEAPSVVTGGPYRGAAADVADLSLDFCPSPYQGQRLANARLEQERPDWSGTVTTTLYGLYCCGERFVHLVIPKLGIDSEFEIVSQPTLNPQNMTVTIGVRSISEDAWNYPASQMRDMAAASSVDNDYTVPAPENLSSSISGGTATVTWNVITDDDYYTSSAQWRLYDPENGPDDGWSDIAVTTPGTASFAVVSGQFYDFRAWRTSSRGYESDKALLPEIEVP